MAYKYRYYWHFVTCVSDREQLEAYARRLRRAGYAADNDVLTGGCQPGDNSITSYAASQVFSFYNHTIGGGNVFEAHQANEAIAKATESHD